MMNLAKATEGMTKGAIEAGQDALKNFGPKAKEGAVNLFDSLKEGAASGANLLKEGASLGIDNSLAGSVGKVVQGAAEGKNIFDSIKDVASENLQESLDFAQKAGEHIAQNSLAGKVGNFIKDLFA